MKDELYKCTFKKFYRLLTDYYNPLSFFKKYIYD